MEQRRHNQRIARLLVRGLGPIALLLAASNVIAGHPGLCYTADVASEMILPDGSVHGPGRLQICIQRFTPVQRLHKTTVEGRPVGMFRSRYRADENAEMPEGAFFVFQRNPEGALTLEGVAVAQRGTVELHEMIFEGQDPRGFEVISHWENARNEEDRTRDRDTVVLVASR